MSFGCFKVLAPKEGGSGRKMSHSQAAGGVFFGKMSTDTSFLFATACSASALGWRTGGRVLSGDFQAKPARSAGEGAAIASRPRRARELKMGNSFALF